jgi:O-antigen/teichoic acid export membrane protein
MLKKLLSHSAIYGLAPSIPKIAGIFVLPIITKYLTNVDFGIAGTIAAYTGAISVFSTLGFNIVLTTSFYKHPHYYKWLWRQIYGFLQYWMIVFAVIQSVMLYFIIPAEAQEHKWEIIFYTNFATVFFGATSLLGTLHYRLMLKPVPIAVRSIISGLLTVIANLVFVAHYKMGYMGWYISTFIAGCFINMSYWRVVNKTWGIKPIFRFKWKTIRRNLNVSLPTVPHYYGSYLLNSSNRLVMSQLNIPVEQIGNFNLASQFGGYYDMFVGAMNTAVNPMAMQQIRDNKENAAKKLIYFMFIVIMFATFLFSLWSKEIFVLMIKNTELQKFYPLAIIIVMAHNYRPMYVASGNMFLYHENTIGLLKITTIAGICALIGYFISIPLWGIWGAAIVQYIFLQYMGYSGFFMKEFKEKTKVQYPYCKIFVLSIVATVSVFFLVELHWMIKIWISSTLLFVLFIVRKLNLDKSK